MCISKSKMTVIHECCDTLEMNALCGLRGLACWSEPSLFATASRMFLRGATHLVLSTLDLTYSYDDMTST